MCQVVKVSMNLDKNCGFFVNAIFQSQFHFLLISLYISISPFAKPPLNMSSGPKLVYIDMEVDTITIYQRKLEQVFSKLVIKERKF